MTDYMSKADVSKIRRETRERREREWIRDSISLRGKPPAYTLRMMFDLCDFAEKLHKAKK